MLNNFIEGLNDLVLTSAYGFVVAGCVTMVCVTIYFSLKKYLNSKSVTT